MRTAGILAVVVLCIASFSVVSAGLAGLRVNKALTDASREDKFEIVTINPTTGLAASTQKSVFALYDGTLDFTNVVFGPSGWVLSLQAFDQAQVSPGLSLINQPEAIFTNFQGSNPVTPLSGGAYLARQDLRDGGRFEYCELNKAIQPILIFWDSDSSVVAITLNTGTGAFNVHRIAFVASASACGNSLLSTLSSLNSVSATLSHQRGNRIYFVSEPAGQFSATAAGAQIRALDISGSIVSQLNPVSAPSTVIPLSLSTLSADVVVYTAWNSALSGTTPGFATYEHNLLTNTLLTPRGVAASTEEVSFASVVVNQTNTLYNLKNVPVSSSPNVPVPQLVGTAFFTASASEAKTANVLNNLNVYRLFDLPNATIDEINVDSATSASIALTGRYTLASNNTGTGAIASTTVSKCKLTYNAGTATSVVVDAQGQRDNTNCPLGTVPSGTTSIDVELAYDGVNYGPKSSFGYAAFNANLLSNGRFVRSQYNFRDATANRGEPVRIILLDSAGRKVVFHQAINVVLTLTPQGNTVLRQAVGTTGTVGNGVVTFPNLAIDLDKAESNGQGNLRATATIGSNTFSTTITVTLTPRTSGTLAALAFPTVTGSATQAFETHLINPSLTTTTAAIRLATRTLQDSNGWLALGLVAYDRDNKVLNTVEVNSNNVVILNGVTISNTQSDNRGSGACRIPTTTSATNDAPTAIFYEATNPTDKTSTFIGLVNNVDGTTTVGRKVVRYTRAAASASTTLCTSQVIDNLPVFDSQYGNHHVQLISGGRLVIVEPDFFFSATNSVVQSISNANAQGYLLSVWQLTTTVGTTTTAGSWLIRNKWLANTFSILGITQSGDDEIAINGANYVDGVAGIVTVDISSQFGAVSALPALSTLNRFLSTTNEQGLFLSAGTHLTNNDARLRYTGTNTPSPAAQSIDTVNLARGLTTASPVNNKDVTGRNYLDFFTLDDPAVTSVTPSAINLNQGTTVSVTATNVISSAQLKCRFSSATGVPTAQDFNVNPASTSSNLLSLDAVTVNCGTFPSSLATSRAWIYVQLSNDGGLNYGPEQRISVGGATDAVNPSTSVGPTGSVVSVSFTVKFRTSLTNPTTTQDSNVRAAITTLSNTLTSIWTKSAITSQVETDGTTSYSITLSTTTSATTRLAALQVTSLTAAQLQSELANVFTPNGVASSVLTAVGVLANGVSITRNTATTTSSSSNGLSDGAIAGIVIGSIVGGFLIIGLIAWLVISNKKATASPYSAAARARSADVGVVSSSTGSSSSSSDYDDDEYDDDYDEEYDDDEDYSDYI